MCQLSKIINISFFATLNTYFYDIFANRKRYFDTIEFKECDDSFSSVHIKQFSCR